MKIALNIVSLQTVDPATNITSILPVASNILVAFEHLKTSSTHSGQGIIIFFLPFQVCDIEASQRDLILP
jgi:hypothetical protein